MFYVKKSGKTDYGVWVLGDLKTETIEISGIFTTNLDEVPDTDKLEVKRLKIAKSQKSKDIKFHLEIL